MRRPTLFVIAILFAAATVLYSAAWIYYVRRPVQVEIGIDTKSAPAWLEATNVYKNSPAEKAGLKTNDRIVAINGRGGASAAACDQLLYRTWLDSHPGDTVTLTVQRPGLSQPLMIAPVFRALEGLGDTRTAARTVAMQILSGYPVFFAVVGLAVLFLRIEDRNAWLLALVFATFITAAPLPNEFAAAPPPLQSFLLAFCTLGNSVLTELFYFFFAVFPTRSPIDRKVPWLKWVLVFIGLCLSLGGYQNGNSVALPIFDPVLSFRAAQTARMIVVYSSIFLGLISLLLNMFSVSSIDDRRKLKVIF
jgi:membrane-associated protease RseP (regulator of RpoE activity)